MPVVGQAYMAMHTCSVAELWYRAAAGSPEAAAHFFGPAQAAFANGAAFPLATLFQTLENMSCPIRPLSQPVTVLWGTQDRSHRATSAHGILEDVPHGQVIVRDDAGHFPELQQPSALLSCLR